MRSRRAAARGGRAPSAGAAARGGRAAARWCALAATALALGVAGCGGSASGGDRPELTVSGATSLTTAFTAYGKRFAGAAVRFSFAGSDELAAQIRQGVRPDVYAAANTSLPDALYREHLVERPQVFAGNRLVLAVPADHARVTSFADLSDPGVTIAMGSSTVPIGAYTRQVLARLPSARRRAILANVRSNEPDVGGIVGKLTQGAVDAGFVYATDVRATHGALRALALPESLQPLVAYGVAIVRGTHHHAAAARFVAGLRHGAGLHALRAAGFEPPP